MKVQSGVRFDKMAWLDFKQLCRKERFKANEVLERFMRVCLDRGTTMLWDRLKEVEEDPEVLKFNLLASMRKLSDQVKDMEENPDRLKFPSLLDLLTKAMVDVREALAKGGFSDDEAGTLRLEAEGLLRRAETLLRTQTR
ncbi:MAG: hypothetical protein QW542_05655 [Thermoproteota archaeon]